MVLEFPGTQQKLNTTRAAANVRANQQLGLAAPGAARQIAQTRGLAGLTQAAGQQAAGVQAAQTQVLANQAQIASQQGQQALQAEQASRQDQLSQQRLRLSQQSRQLNQALSSQQAGVNRELYDNNLAFRRDELGRTLFNERQLADYAVNNTKSQEELLVYEQVAQQAQERLEYTYKQAYAVLEQQEQQMLAQENQYQNQEQIKSLALEKQAVQNRINNAKNRAANTSAIFAGMTTIGAAITPIFPPAGLFITGTGLVGTLATTQKKEL